MAVRFQCPACNTPLKILEELRGKQLHCPKCKHIVTVPTVPKESPPTPAPRTSSKNTRRQQGDDRNEEVDNRPRPKTWRIGVLCAGAGGFVVVAVLIVLLLKSSGAPQAQVTENNVPPADAQQSDANVVATETAAPTKVKAVETEEALFDFLTGPADGKLNGQQIYEKVLKSCVCIISDGGSGSGSLVNVKDRLIITN